MAKELYSYDIVRLTRKERLPNSFISTEVHPIEGRGSKCVIVTTLEIDSPWHHAREFGQQIISTLIREFVRSQSNSNLMRFEHALKLANHTIGQAAEKLGVNISCAVALFIEQEVHFTVIGNCRLLLFRNNTLTDVTANDSSQPGQFSSVTSGDLADQEWLMVASQGVVQFLRNQDVATWGEQDTGALAAELIEQAPALERQNFFATLLRFRQDSHGHEQTVLWDNLEHTTPIRLPKFSLPKVSTAPLVNAAASLRNSLRTLRDRRAKQKPLTSEASPVDSSPEIFEAPEPLLRRIRLPKLQVRLPRLSKKTVITAVVLLVVILIGYRAIASRVNKASEAAPGPNLLEQLSGVSVDGHKNFLASDFSLDRFLELSSDDQQQFSRILEGSNIALLQPSSVITELDKEIVALDALGTTLAAIDTTGQLWIVREGRTIKTEQSLLIQSPRSLAVVSPERIVVSDSASNLWLFDGSTTAQPIALTQPASLGAGTKLVHSYNGNLYVYAPESKTVFRQAAFDKELSSLRSSGKFDQISSLVSDLAINGQVIAISDQGQVVGLLAGKAVLNGTVSSDSDITRIASVESQPDIAILTGRFITSTDKDFTVKKMYFLATKGKPGDLIIDPSTGSPIAAIGNKIYSVAL